MRRTQWMLDHRVLACCAFVAAAAVGGYFGLDSGRTGPQPFPHGVAGSVAGTALAVVVLGLVALTRTLRPGNADR